MTWKPDYITVAQAKVFLRLNDVADDDEIADFVTVFNNIEMSPFLRGDHGWKGCTFDWVFKKANFQKILEGNYND